MRVPRHLAIALILLLTSTSAWAQATAEVNGRVTDESGGVLPGVTVTVTQTDTGFTRSVVTEANGLRGLEPADRSLQARGRAAGVPHLRADRHRPAGGRDADDQRGAV